ncbi:TetR family transcriptional regulator [Lactococcus hodotermopsidis]|uniref:TetR family transcriptional regulator n=1 Tax=Pseudolactococcus hodotermopsidis TaxID=2709157 RepID=A0A6A0BCP8_9LACT|nr:TetR-like C-terminal domain-containing protein [Lactococcus hodotermopsidis]GFH42473.1 TetR family transcriptional regulator [Lactococcus hodotermopsidis]
MTDIRITKTRRAIEQAMSDLLKEKSFDQITTTELVKRAGISRSSFYTHYQDKYEMIDTYQRIFFTEVEYIFDRHSKDWRAAIYEIFEFLAKESVLSALLSENGTREIHIFLRQKLKSLLTTVIHPHFGRQSLDKVNLDYRTTYFSHAIFGMVQLWISRGKKESPQEITDTLIPIIRF